MAGVLPVWTGIPRLSDLTARHRELMPQDGDLDVLLVGPTIEADRAQRPACQEKRDRRPVTIVVL
jgi:hypothetical protein